MPYAQTNIQLYNQMREGGYTDDDLKQTRAAYELAMQIFTGHYRPNNKSFLAHLCGVASILVVNQEKSNVIIAGLLHSIYSHGEFGNGIRGAHQAKRARVKSVVGEAVEQLIIQYTKINWNIDTLRSFHKDIGNIENNDRAALVIKLADILEDYLDQGMGYSSKTKSSGGLEDAQFRPVVVEMADKLGHHSLAEELKALLIDAKDIAPPEILQNDRRVSFLLAPLSYRIKTKIKFRQVIQRLRNRWT